MVVVKVADEDVADKLDTEYVANQFVGLDNIGVIFVCTVEGEDDRDYEEDGVRYIRINLPYNEVQQLADAKFMMLTKLNTQLRR